MEEQIETTLNGGEFKRLLKQQFSRIKEKYGLKKVEIEVLYFLSRNKEKNTPTDIHCHLKMNKGHISQAIDSLYKKEYIVATTDKEDRRIVHYSVTDQAKETVEDISAIKKEVDDTIFKGITGQEMEVFRVVIKKIENNIREMME